MRRTKVDVNLYAVGCVAAGGWFVLATVWASRGDAVKAAVSAVLALAYGVLSAIRTRDLKRELRAAGNGPETPPATVQRVTPFEGEATAGLGTVESPEPVPPGFVRLPYPMKWARCGHDPVAVTVRREQAETYAVSLAWPDEPPTTHRGLTVGQARAWVVFAKGDDDA